MRRLILLRHAKSLSDATMKDKDRPLNARGRGDAPRMGGYMHHKRYLPQLVLCSSAKRTVETWELLGAELDISADVRISDALYLASAGAMEKTIRAVDAKVSALLVIGHNPGLEECAQALARAPGSAKERKLEEELQTKFPTCALAVLDFEVDEWSRMAAASAQLFDFMRPKDLKDE
jgi:phosphohistidine phosphatase